MSREEGSSPSRHYHPIDTDHLTSASGQVEVRLRSKSPAEQQEVFNEEERKGNGEGHITKGESTKALPMQTRALRLSSGPTADEISDCRKTPVNCQEKIIFCFDTSSELTTTYFTSKTGDREPQSLIVRKVVRMFLSLKSSMNPQHEYALMLLGDKAFWMCDFDSDITNIATKIDAASRYSEYDSCDLSTVFEEVKNHVVLYNNGSAKQTGRDPAMYTVRVILLYGRSHCIPQLTHTKVQEKLQASPYFFIDVLYLHEPVSADNECEKIYEILCNVDVNNTSYILEASKNPTKVYDFMAQMIGHPLQRCLQHHIDYVIE